MPLATALLVIDAQESFRHRPYWTDGDFPRFLDRLRSLIAGAREQGIPVVQIFHVETEGAFSLESGWVRAIEGLEYVPAAVFHKQVHSALAGTGLERWLISRGIQRLIVSGIRTEQCCETTTRHASDLGFQVDYVLEATLTFPMTDRAGRVWTPQEIQDRTALVLEGRFARVVTVEQALAGTGTAVAAP